MKRKICVFTSTRAEYGLLRWVMNDIELSGDLDLQLLVSGTHLSPAFGMTVEEIEEGESAQVMVRLRVGGSLLLARITSKSSMALGLQPGKGVFAQVKSVALLDET